MTEVNAGDAGHEHTGSQVLSGRLPAMPPERAAAIARILATGDVLVRDNEAGRLELRNGVEQGPPHAVTVELTQASGRVELVMTEESGSARIGDRVWHDFSGEERLLAWALAYETLVTELSALLGTALLPIELGDAPRRSERIWYWLAWRFDQGDGVHCRGVLGLDQAALAALADAEGWRHDDATDAAASRGLPLPCKVSLQPLILGANELRALKCGDVILLGQRTAALASLRLRIDNAVMANDAQYAWAVAVVPAGISLTRALTRAELRSDMMTPDSPAPRADAAPDETPATRTTPEDPRTSIDVRVEIVLDTFGMTLAEIDRMSAGQVLPLTQPIDHARVTLRANGKAFGVGELVALGDTLGVKLVRIGESRGLQ